MPRRRDWVATRNAADPVQVKHAGRAEKDDDERRMDTLRAVMAQRDGRDFVWDLLTDAGVYESVMDRQPEMTYYYAGQQDFGHRLLASVVRADPENYVVMEREQRAREANQALSAKAVQERDKTDELMQ